MVHNYSARYKDILLRPLLKKDIEVLRRWRNNTEAVKYLRNIGEITPEMQEKWFKSYLLNNDEYSFSIIDIGDLHTIVGSVSLYNFKNTQAEVGKIQIGDARAHGKGIGRTALVMITELGFKSFGLKKIVAGVNQCNIASHSNFMKVGFKIIGTHPSVSSFGGTEDEIEIDLPTLEKANPYATDIEMRVGYEE